MFFLDHTDVVVQLERVVLEMKEEADDKLSKHQSNESLGGLSPPVKSTSKSRVKQYDIFVFDMYKQSAFLLIDMY